MRAGIIVVDNDLLLAVLGLPPDAQIRAVRDNFMFGRTEFVVEHPGLPPVEKGCTFQPVGYKAVVTDGRPKFKGWTNGPTEISQ